MHLVLTGGLINCRVGHSWAEENHDEILTGGLINCRVGHSWEGESHDEMLTRGLTGIRECTASYRPFLSKETPKAERR
jgi:hypothetical protein